MKKLATNLARTFEKAAGRMRQASEYQPDPDLRLYETLTDADFKDIEAKYGQDNLVNYIQTMEAKRLKGGKNA